MIEVNMVEIGKRIKDLRIESGMTQTQLAQKIGVATNTVSQYEKGLSKTSIDVIVNLAFVLQTTTDYLLGWID